MGFGSFSGGLGFGLQFTLEDGFSSVASSIQSKMSQFDTQVERMAEKVNASMGRVQSGFGLIATGIGMAAPLAYGVKVAGDFEQARIGLETFLGSAAAAASAFENIKKDAAVTPFGVEPLLAVNRALISTGVSADRARQDTMGLANAIAAAGMGNPELQRMGINLQQIKNAGGATAADIKQFAYAGINIFQLLADATGKTKEEVKEMTVTYDLLTYALNKAAGEGGIYAGALERQAVSINGKLEALGDKVKFLAEGLGKSVLGIVHPLFDSIIKGLGALTDFMDTDLGRTLTQIAAFGIALAALSVIAVGVGMVLSGIKSAIVAVTGVLGISLWPIIAVGAGFIIIRNSLQSFNDVLEGTAEPANGLLGIMQRIGAVFSTIGELWKNVNFADATTKLSEPMMKALDKLGLREFAADLATWIIRIKVAWISFTDIFSTAWKASMDVIGAASSMIEVISGTIADISLSFGIGKSNLDTWVVIAKGLGYIFGGILAVATAVGFVVIQIATAVVGVISLISNGIDWLTTKTTGWGEVLRLVIISPFLMVYEKVRAIMDAIGALREFTEGPAEVRLATQDSDTKGIQINRRDTKESPFAGSKVVETKSKQNMMLPLYTSQANKEKQDNNQPIVLQATFNVDGKKMAEAVSKHNKIESAREAHD